MKPSEGRKRVVIEAVRPQVDGGRYAVRSFLGDRVTVSAALFGDGHDHVAGRLLFRHEEEVFWRSVPLASEGNDLWSASFTVDRLGVWQYAVEGWVDHLGTWCADLGKRLEAQPGRAGGSQAAIGAAEHNRSQAIDPSEPGDRIAQSNSFGADPVRPSPQSDIPLALRTGAALLREIAGRAEGTDGRAMEEFASALESLADR